MSRYEKVYTELNAVRKLVGVQVYARCLRAKNSFLQIDPQQESQLHLCLPQA